MEISGILYRCNPDQVGETLEKAKARHIEKYETEAVCVYINPVNFSDYESPAEKAGLRIEKDRTILVNHFLISAHVKN